MYSKFEETDRLVGKGLIRIKRKTVYRGIVKKIKIGWNRIGKTIKIRKRLKRGRKFEILSW